MTNPWANWRKAGRRKEGRNPWAIIIYSHIMAAVKASTCINVFMRRRTSTHTHTLACQSVLHERAAKENAQHSRGKKGRGGGGNAKKTITIHNSVGCQSASGTRPASDVRLCCVVLLMSLPHSCRCIASMPQRGIFHIGMCTMEITMQSQAATHKQPPKQGPKISNQVHFRTHTNQNVVGRATSQNQSRIQERSKQQKGTRVPFPPGNIT